MTLNLWMTSNFPYSRTGRLFLSQESWIILHFVVVEKFQLLIGCFWFHSPDLGRPFLIPFRHSSHHSQNLALYFVLDPRKIAISKLVPLSFLDHPFGFARMEVVLYYARSSCSSWIEFLGWPNALSSWLYICSVYTLRYYPQSLFVQYAIMSQLEDWGPFSLRYAFFSWAHPPNLAMTLGLTSVRQHNPQTEVRPLRARILSCLTWPST